MASEYRTEEYRTVNIEQVPCCKKKLKAESGVSGIRSRRGQVQRKKEVIVYRLGSPHVGEIRIPTTQVGYSVRSKRAASWCCQLSVATQARQSGQG